MHYRVVKITKNPAGYPEAVKDTEEFPELVARVEDETEIFIVDETGEAHIASEFFYEVAISGFTSDEISGSVPQV